MKMVIPKTKKQPECHVSFGLHLLLCLTIVGLSPVLVTAKGNDTLRVTKDSVITLKSSEIRAGKIKSRYVVNKPVLVKPAKAYKVGTTRSFAGLHNLPILPLEKVDMQALYQQRIQTPPTDSIRKLVNRIEADFRKVTQENRFIKKIVTGELLKLKFPQAIGKQVNGKTYVLTLHGVKFRGKQGAIQVSLKVPVEQTQGESSGERALYFWGEVRFTQDGGFNGGQIGLLVDFPLKFGDNILTFRKTTLGSERVDGTFATFDCNGFKDMGIRGMLEFSRNVLVPETPQGKRDPNPEHRVKGTFSAVAGGWNDILLEIDLPQRFQATNLPRFGFQVNKAVLDLSDERNAAGQQFPSGYLENYLPGDDYTLWRGLSIQHFALWLPPEFKKEAQGSTSQRVTIQARNALIDQRGFTGEIFARNIIEPGQGKMGKWAFSVENLYLKLEATQLRAGNFAGRIKLPISQSKNDAPTPANVADDPAYLKYSVIINPADGDYVATVQYTKEMSMNLWAAKMQVKPSSYLELGVKDNRFLAKAVLNGKFTDIGGEKFSQTLRMKDIEFERLTVMTEAPYLSVGQMSFGGLGRTQKLGGFTFTLDRIGFVEGTAERVGQYGLQVGGKVNFVKGNNSFGAEAYGTVYGRLEDTPLGFQIPVFQDVELSRAVIDIDMGAFRLAGYVEYYKADPVYGHGFKGAIQAGFGKKPMRINVEAMAMFGNVKGFNYWFADAMMAFKPAIPLVTNGIQLSGFGGGAYYHMTRTLKSDYGNILGRTRSGISYEPDKETFLGIKASVMLQGPTASAYNGEAGFEIAFNRNGGIRKIGFDASLVVASPGISVDLGVMKKVTEKITQLEAKADDKAGGLLSQLKLTGNNEPASSYSAKGNGAIKAMARVDYDVENRTLHANLNVDIDVAGGVIRGGGDAVFHFAPDTWYVHIGTPQKRIGLNIMNVVQTGSYFMLGDHLPEMPPPPENVIRILGLENEYNKERDDAALLAGKGFAFGSSFKMDTGPMNFLMFYARFAAGLGYDVMLKKYADGISCKGRENKGIGINNWFAQGQAYGFFEGEIGIRVNLPFKKGNFPIIQGELAALMQAQLPNPVWVRGIVGGRFSILGGLVKGNCRFELEIGQKCELVGGNALSGIEIISDISPAEGTPEVDVFTSPQATFNIAVEEMFEIRDIHQDKLQKYRVKLDHFKVTERSTSKVVEGAMEWNEDHTALSFVPKNILPSEKVLHADIQVSFEKNQSGIWRPVSGVVEKKSLDFKTGKAPDHIVRKNIAYSYPIIQQLNFYPQEAKQGYIQLKQGRPDLFTDPKVTQNFSQVMRFTAAANPDSFREVPFTYDDRNKQITFDIPQDLGKQVAYHWSIVNKPKGKSAGVGENVTKITKKVGGSQDIKISKKELQGTRIVYKEKKVFEAGIRTSLYPTMQAKFESLSRTSGWSWPVMTSVHILGATYTGKETFDYFEAVGDKTHPPLIEMEAAIQNTPWYKDAIHPLIYKNLWAASLDRKPRPYGIPPFKALFINQDYKGNLLSEETMQPAQPMAYRGAFIFNVPPMIQRDYMATVYKVAAMKQKQSADWMNPILSTPFPSIYSGSYEVIIRYRLPGSGRITFERRFTIVNP